MSRRILQLNQLIKKELSKIIEWDFSYPQTLVTVTEVSTSPDLSETKVRISIYPSKNETIVLDALRKKLFDFQRTFNKRLIIRKVPKIKFELDKRPEEADKIERLLEKNKKSD